MVVSSCLSDVCPLRCLITYLPIFGSECISYFSAYLFVCLSVTKGQLCVVSFFSVCMCVCLLSLLDECMSQVSLETCLLSCRIVKSVRPSVLFTFLSILLTLDPFLLVVFSVYLPTFSSSGPFFFVNILISNFTVFITIFPSSSKSSVSYFSSILSFSFFYFFFS